MLGDTGLLERGKGVFRAGRRLLAVDDAVKGPNPELTAVLPAPA
ncbi:hypothetical protein [Mycobacterium asiaticum]|nr:hypothetical protein [Mycobacterium asiaticum]